MSKSHNNEPKTLIRLPHAFFWDIIVQESPSYMTNHPHQFYEALFKKVSNSELFKTYQSAFRSATGLPLSLIPAGENSSAACNQDVNSNTFCKQLSLCSSACQACISVNEALTEKAKINGPSSCHCFSGMVASAVPISCNGRMIGMLRTGQIFHSVPTESLFKKVTTTLKRQGLKESEIKLLKDAYFQTKVVDPERYQSMVTLLSTFGEQLNVHAEKLATMDDGSEPAAVARAKKFIDETLSAPLPLSVVARRAGLSESHFCRVFKESTGLTLTDYVNRRRVEWAKRELLKPETRVSEIAFHIGYQSLSQFNRSFARFTGNSPTNFRRQELARASSI